MWFQTDWVTQSRKGALAFGDTAGPYTPNYLYGNKYLHGWVLKGGFMFITPAATKNTARTH